MKQDQKSAAPQAAPKSNKEWLWWTLLGVFVVGSIGAMLAVDMLYAPELNNPATLPEAVGK